MSSRAVAGPPQVAVVGSANIDLVARCETPPQPGETVLGTSFAAVPGGKGANQATAVARSGLALASFLGAVGRDEHGALLRNALRSDGVDLSRLREADAAPTGTALITVAADGQNSIIVVPGANALMRELTDDDRRVLRESDAVLAQLEIPIEIVGAAFSVARENGVLTVLNAAPARTLPAELLAVTDLLVVNEIEAAVIARGKQDDPQKAAQKAAPEELCEGLLTLVPRVALTLGDRGVVYRDRDGTRHTIPALPAEAVDTTGAGDTFTGVLVGGLVSGRPVDTALRYACAAASVSVERPGATASIPYAAEIEARYSAL